MAITGRHEAGLATETDDLRYNRRKNGMLTTLGGFAILLMILWLCVP